jgi:cellulose synthase/poly-beta-1,6-N-acetylglucosamine synthase-like glycosyltransferase
MSAATVAALEPLEETVPDGEEEGIYDRYAETTGPLQPPDPEARVRFRPVLTRRQRSTLGMLVLFNLFVTVGFLMWLLQPQHRPSNQGAPWSLFRVMSIVAYVSLIAVEFVRFVQNSSVWLFASRMRDPVPVVPETGLRVAVLTTIVPSKEPVDVLASTVEGMRRIEYDGQVDVWVLDEEDDPAVRRLVQRLGAYHFSRKDRPEYNQDRGAFRRKTKAGNHNAWRAEHEGEYDVVAQMDPDHCPLPDFLNRTLGYFRDPDVAFVVAPQVYDNIDESFVSGAAADQAYTFHGVIQRGGNGLDAPLLIGTNHLYRPEAWCQIGGYQDSVIEDHLTSLRVHASVNPMTGRRWKGVYTPDILAVGEGPATWTDYFNQQKRWAYGIWDVVLNHSRALFRHLSWRQRASYAALELFYPSLALTWVLGGTVTALYLLFGATAVFLEAARWAGLWGATVLAQLALVAWMRQFNLGEHERHGLGLNGQLLSLFAGPVYVAAAAAALTRRGLQYVVTAKGNLASPDSWDTFRSHVAWVVAGAWALAASAAAGHSYWVLRLWAVFTVAAAAGPMVMYWRVTRAEQRLLWVARGRTVSAAYFSPVPRVAAGWPSRP